MNRKKILITGAAGFIGFHLQKELTKKYLVDGIDELDNSKNASLIRNQYSTSVRQDRVQNPFLNILDVKPNILIHLAAETGISGSLSNPTLYFQQNVEGTFNVLEQCRKNGVKYLIYASSSSVYEPNQSVMAEDSPTNNQLSFYGTSKKMTELMVENYCKQFGLTAIGLRFFTVYGSWTRPDMAAYKFMTAINESRPITLYNQGNVYRDFTHVSDIVHSISLLLDKIQKEKAGFHEIFNIGFGAPISVKQYATIIAQNLNKELIYEFKELPQNELFSTHCDTSKLDSYIQYKPICKVQDGIFEMTNWFKYFQYV
jgi:UDP-glucuronate 4-epimerase